jgi:hypothetical protein
MGMLALFCARRNLQMPQTARRRSLRDAHAQVLVVVLEDNAMTIAGQSHFVRASQVIAVPATA